MRSPIIVTLSALIAAAAFLAATAAPIQEKQANPIEQGAKKSPPVKAPQVAALEKELLLERTKHYIARLGWARRELQLNCIPEALDALDDCRPELRGWEYAYLRWLCERHLCVLDKPGGRGWAVAYSTDGKRLASTNSRDIKVWDAGTGDLVTVLEGHKGYVGSVAFSSDGKLIASSTTNRTPELPDMGGSSYGPGEINVWDVATGKVRVAIKGESGEFDAIAFSPDCRWVATSSGKREVAIVIWDLATGKKAYALDIQKSGVWNLVFSPDGRRLASSTWHYEGDKYDSQIKVWELATRKTALKIEESGNVIGLAFNPDGKCLAVCYYDGTIKEWDLASGKTLQTLKTNTGGATALSFDTAGKRLASVSYRDGTLKIWDLAAGKSAFITKGDRSGLHDTAFSPDGQHVATAGLNGTVCIWGLAPGKE